MIIMDKNIYIASALYMLFLVSINLIVLINKPNNISALSTIICLVCLIHNYTQIIWWEVNNNGF